MNIVFIASDLVLGALTIEKFILSRRGEKDKYLIVVGDFILPGKSTLQSLKYIYNKSGFRYVKYKTIETLGLLIMAKISQLLRTKNILPTMNYLSKKYSIPLYTTDNVNSKYVIEIIRDFNPDCIISIVMQKIKSALISLPKYGVLNMHPALLPDYQGLGAYFRPIIDGVEKTGSTVHYISDENLDTGEILGKALYKISNDDTSQALCMKNFSIGGILLAKILKEIEKNNIIPMSQGIGRYYSFPSREIIRKFLDKKRTFVRISDIVLSVIKDFNSSVNIEYEIRRINEN